MIMMPSVLFTVSFRMSKGSVVVGVDSSDRSIFCLYSIMRTKPFLRRFACRIPDSI